MCVSGLQRSTREVIAEGLKFGVDWETSDTKGRSPILVMYGVYRSSYGISEEEASCDLRRKGPKT
jgi:hypothetical protein